MNNMQYKLINFSKSLFELAYQGTTSLPQKGQELNISKGIDADVKNISSEEGRAEIEVDLQVTTEPHIFRIAAKYNTIITFMGSPDEESLKMISIGKVSNDIDFLLSVLTEKTIGTYLFMPSFQTADETKADTGTVTE